MPNEECLLRGRSHSALLRPAIPLVIGILLLLTLIFGAIRFRLRNMPLERDEGEYAYSGQLLLQGIPPYKLAYNLKLPGIYAAYAIVLATFGQSAAGIHLGLLLINAGTILLIYILTARLFGRLAGLVAAASYAVLSASPSVMGFEAHATNFVLPPILLGILLLLEGSRLRNRWLICGSGFLFGIGFLMKQHGVFFVFFCCFYLLIVGRKQRQSWREFLSDLGALGAGFILPYAITCWLLYRAGVFQQFWFWTVSYAGEYSKMGLRRGVHSFVENYGAILHANPLLWIIALAGLLAPIWSVEARRHWGFTGLLLLFSFLSLCPGAYFRPHYFILLLPAIALLTGIAVGSATAALADSGRRRAATLIPILFLGALGFSIFQQRELYFSLDPAAAMEATYGTNPFLAAMKAADYVRQNSPEDAQVAVLGSEPEIYFYARRRSATGYLYMYSLIVRQKYTARMQQELIHEVETHRPEYLIYADVAQSWGAERDSAPQASAFLNWVREYTRSYYDTVAVAETGGSAGEFWVDASKGYKPVAGEAIYVMKRKSQSVN